MARSKAVREEVLALDNFRSQISGFGGQDMEERELLQVHHDKRLGMGGSRERDTVENCITVTTTEHGWLHASPPVITIKQWDRDAGILEVFDHQSVLLGGPGPVPHDNLWFYGQRLKEEGEQITTRLSAYSLIERDVARDAYRLKHRFHTIDPAVTFLEYLAARGLASSALNDAALLYARSLELGFEWKDGVTATDYRRQLKDAGLIKQRKFWHMSFKSGRVLRAVIRLGWLRLTYCTSDEFADTGRIGLKLGKLFILRSVKGKLLGSDGKELPYTELEESEK